MMHLRLEINDDLEHVLTKIARKRTKGNLGKLINQILKEWLEEEDLRQYNKSDLKKNKNKSRE